MRLTGCHVTPRRGRRGLRAVSLAWALGVFAACGSGGGAGPADALLPDRGGLDAGASDALDAGADTDAGPPRSLAYYDVNHVLSTGQSLSVGAFGSPPLSTTQPYQNRMFVTGVMAGGTGLTSFVPLVEGDTLPGTAQVVETMSSGFANLVTKAAREGALFDQPVNKQTHDMLVSLHGVSGVAYAGLKKGTAPYAEGMAQAKAGHDLAGTQGLSYAIRAVTTVHGETDHNNGNLNYEANLVEWQSSYETDVHTLTGQTGTLPLFQTQMSSWTKLNGAVTSPIPSAQLAAHVDQPGKIILVGPKYHLPYYVDGVHLTNEGYRHMGEDYAKVYRRVVVEGGSWEPLRPKTVTRAGNVVTITFFVPAPPLVLDTTLVSDPGHSGFAFADNSGSTPTITAVAVTGADTVQITLSKAPTGTVRTINYAASAPGGSSGGPTTGPRGNLRDSDATASRFGYALYNWCVHFGAPVP